MIEMKRYGTAENADLCSLTVSVATGAVTATYMVRDGNEVAYRTVAVAGVATSVATFLAAVVGPTKNAVDAKAEPVEKPLEP